MILLGLRSVLCHGNPIVFCGESVQEELAFEAFCDQEEIGWNHFLLGNLSNKWKAAMESHYAQLAAASDEKLPQHLSAKVWTKKLLCHVLHISLNRWQIRNECHHALKEDSDYRAARENLLDKLEVIFAKRHPSIQAFRTLFTHTYHSLASLPNSGIRNWLKSYGLLQSWQKGELGTFMGLSNDPSKSDTFRIRLHNRNGFNTKFLLQDFESFVVSELAAESSFTGITEVNVTASKSIPFHDICKKFDHSSRLYQSFPLGKPTKKDSAYHKGGQLCFIPSFTYGRKHSMERDSHGRWTVVRLNGADKVVSIITAYRVCSNSFNLAGNTIVDREVRSLLSAKHPQWDRPRDAFLTDLGEFVKNERKANRAVFLGGDLNSSIHDEDIQQFMDSCGFYNLLEGDELETGTSCTRSQEDSGLIDLAMGTIELAVALLSAGARGFYNDSNSDHRLLELSFSKESLFKHNAMDKSQERHFNIKNRKQRELYLKTLADLHRASNTADAIQSCKDAFEGKGNMSREEAIKKMKNIEQRSTEYMQLANKAAAPPVSLFRYHHSDSLSNAGKALRHANHLLQNDPDSLELKEAKDAAVKNLLKVKTHSDKYREEMANGRSLDAMDKYKCEEKSAIRQIVNHEKISKQHASVKKSLATERRGALDRIVVPQPTETTKKDPEKITWCPVVDPKDIEDVLFRQNHRHLLQSNISVFARGPISDLLGEECSNADDILDGNIDIAEIAKAYGHLEEATTLLLKEMQRRRDDGGEAVVMDWQFGREEFRAAFSRARNNTAPGFSGLPMTYWKAICEDDALCDIYAALLETAFKQGFTYDRWLKSIQAMLQKKDLPYYMKLRIIELFELDYNAVLKFLFGKVFARYEQAAGFQNNESYGAVQGRSAHQALNSALIVYEHSRVTASPMAASPQDATGCFDLIRPEQTGIIQQAKGLNKEATMCNMQVLHGMERHIRTAAGVTERSLKFDKKNRNYGGIGQGSGNGPQHGNDTNGLNKDILARETQSYEFKHPNGSDTISRDGNAFIDDIIHFVLLSSNCFIAAVPTVTRKLQLWQNLLNASGEDLAIDKCVIVFLLYKTIFENGKSKVMLKPIEEEPGDISLQPSDQEAARINICRIEPYEGERYLGARAAGNGNWRDEYKHRVKQMKSMASKVHTCTLDRNDSHLLYSTRYKPTISYPLHHTTFTDKECDKLQSPFLRAILPKMGFNRNFPRAVVHGPYALGGNQIIDVKVEQFVLQLVDMMTSIRKMDIIGEQLNSRIMFLWEKVHKYGIELRSKHFWVPMSSKANDQSLMDAFISLRKRRRNTPQRITSNELHNANEVRLFLQCTFLSDIIDEDGKIDKSIFDADQRCETTESYPMRERPNEIAIDAWKKCLQGAFITGDREVLPSLKPTDQPIPATEPDGVPSSVEEYLSRQPQHIKDILGKEITEWNESDINSIRVCLENDQDIEIFGNGTVKNGTGAHYYAIKPAICENSKSLGIHGGAKTSSNSSGLVSLRPESFSIVAALNILKAAIVVYNIQSSDS
ncbi:hypothetical protein CTEN210_12729 [Chaetoceros tenuissimus]|uniref:Uncharacterized protein n=1 Tax=Chaetoceros tenuissimus TaxID=426638 RepID=A0AAD3HAS3_9STRA|nr:hypothetical protein CTEN210_12729 [Chaetoceros tenuissimus]